MLEIDLHGQDSFEAKVNLQVFLVECRIKQQKIAKISHGYGKGILRDVVTNELKNSDLVDKFYLAHPNDGGAGITIIEFK